MKQLSGHLLHHCALLWTLEFQEFCSPCIGSKMMWLKNSYLPPCDLKTKTKTKNSSSLKNKARVWVSETLRCFPLTVNHKTSVAPHPHLPLPELLLFMKAFLAKQEGDTNETCWKMPFFLFAKIYRNRPMETTHRWTPDPTPCNNKAHQHACAHVAETVTH